MDTIKLPTTVRNDGPACAAFLAAGIGSVVFGLSIVAAEVSKGAKDALNWWDPAGPLAGKSSVGVIAWLAAWLVLYLVWRKRDVSFKRVWIATVVLLVLGFALTFPPVFTLFASH